MIAIHRGSNILLEVGVNQGSIRRFNLMKEDFIRLKFSLTENKPLLIGDYVDLTDYINSCDNENFRIKDDNTDQTTKKFVVDRNYSPTFNKNTGGWDYDVQINAYYHQWKNKIFMFNPSKGAAESSFSLTDTIFAHAALLVNNIKSAGFTYNNTEFNVAYQEEFDGQLQAKGMKPITYSAVSNYAALDLIAQAFECEWWLDGGSTIYFGYRKGNETTELTLNDEIADASISDSDGVHATRIYAFGGTTNVPTHYRDKLVFEVNSYWVENGTIKGVKDSRKPVLSSYFRGDKGKADSRLLTISKATSSKGEFASEENTPDIAAVTSTSVVSIEGQTYDVDLSNLKINFKATHLVGPEGESTGLIEVGKDINIRASVVATDGTNEDVIASEVRNIKIDRGTPTTSVAFTNSQRKFSFVPSSIEIRVEVTSAEWTYTKHMGDENLVDGKWYDYKLVEFEFSKEQAVISFQKSAQSAETIIRINGGTRDYTSIINPDYKDGGSNILITDYTGAWEDIKTYTFPNIVISRVPSQYFSPEDGGVQNGVVQKNLMLPVGTNYVQADGVADANVVEAIMVYDWIYPKTALKVTDVEPFNEWKVEIEEGQTVDTTTYDITLPIEDYEDDLWVDPSKMFAIFQSGKAAGLRFELNYVKNTNNDVTFRLVPNEDYSITVPNEATIPVIDDEIILEGIDISFLSGSAITNAENELLAQANKDILETSKENKVVDITLSSDYAYNKGRIALGTLTSLVDVLSSEDNAYDSRILGFEECLDIPWDKPKYIIGDKNYYNRQASIESKLENIEKGSITLNGVNIGGVGSNIPIIKVKDSTKPTDANVYSALRSREEFAKRKEEETFSEKVTFNKDIDVKGKASVGSLEVGKDANIKGNQSVGGNQTINGTQEVGGLQTLHGGFQTSNFNNAAGQITGAHLTPDGKLYVSVLKANNFEIDQLIFNVVKAQGGEYVYSTSCEIESCIYVMKDGSQLTPDAFYALADHDWHQIAHVLITLKEDEFTQYGNPFVVGDIIYGKVNKVQESGKHAVGGECIMHITAVEDNTLNITAQLYQVGEYGLVGNIPPIEDMVIAHRGNKDGVQGRTTSFYLSTITGNLVMLYNVTTPTLSAANYGATFGKLPYDLYVQVLTHYAGLQPEDPVVYAKYLVTENWIQRDHLGQPIKFEVYRGDWRYDVAVSDKPYVVTLSTYDTVTHNGAKWRVVTSNTKTEPRDGFGDWERLTDANITVYALAPSSNIIYIRDAGVVTPSELDVTVKSTTSLGEEIISDQATLVARNLTVWYTIDGGSERKMLVLGGTKVFVAEDGSVFVTEAENDNAPNVPLYLEGESIDLSKVSDNITLYLVENYPDNPADKASYVIPVVNDGASPLGLELTPSALSVPVDATTLATAGVRDYESTVRLKQGVSYIDDISEYTMQLTYTLRSGEVGTSNILDTDYIVDDWSEGTGWKIYVQSGNGIVKNKQIERIDISILHGEAVIATGAILFNYLERGITGPAGKDGPFLYPAGTWNAGTEYKFTYQLDSNGNIVNDSDNNPIVIAKPFVYYKSPEGAENYYVLEKNVPEGSNIAVTNTEYWKPFTKIQYIFTEALMANWARLGGTNGAYFWGNYMFSTRGIDERGNSIDIPAFAESMFTDGKLNGTIIPNLFLDFYSGGAKFGKLTESYINIRQTEYTNGKHLLPRYDIDLNGCHNVSCEALLNQVDTTCVVVMPKNIPDSEELIIEGTHSTVVHQYNAGYSMNPYSAEYAGCAVMVVADNAMFESSTDFGSLLGYDEVQQEKMPTNGWFIWKGCYRSKFVMLAPGAMLKLRSCMLEDGGMVWFVENSSDFEILNARMEIYADYYANSNNTLYEFASNDTITPESLYRNPIIIGTPTWNHIIDPPYDEGIVTSWVWDVSGHLLHSENDEGATNRFLGAYLAEKRTL